MNRPTAPEPRRVHRRLAVAALALLALASLTACRPDQVGSAAIVDGDTITVGELQDATQEFLALAPSVDPGEAQLRILERMIVSRVIERAADEAGVRATTGEVASQRDRILQQIGGRKRLVQALASQQQQTVLAPGLIDQWTRDQVLFAKIAERAAPGAQPGSPESGQAASQALVAAGRDMDIEVNPRYGRWNPTRGLMPEVSGGLSKSVDELTGSGPGQQ